MKREEELAKQLADMVKDTKAGKVFWNVECQTTEYNEKDQKPQVEEDGVTWTVDECYVSYHCEYKGKEFVMITYEMLHSAVNKSKTTNLIFLPPLGIRYFDIHSLLPYSVEATQILTYHIHELWTLCLEMYKKNPNSISLNVSERVLTIED